MACFSLGVICDSLEDVNELIYPFHNEFIGYYPKEYFDINKEEKKHLKFNSYSRNIEKEWNELSEYDKNKFKNIERYADVNHGYYYNEEKSDIGYYTNENGKMFCFSVGGIFSDLLKIKGGLTGKKTGSYAKIKDLLIPDRKEKFGTYALITDGKWHCVDDYDDREEWFKIHCKRLIRKAEKEKLLVVVECSY